MTDFEGIAGRLLVWSDEDPNGSIGQASKQMEKMADPSFYVLIYLYLLFIYCFLLW